MRGVVAIKPVNHSMIQIGLSFSHTNNNCQFNFFVLGVWKLFRDAFRDALNAGSACS